MKKAYVAIIVMILFVASSLSYAGQRGTEDILKQGLLGTGAGAVGGAVSGAKGKNLWKGALAGAGVTIVGGALLDSITGEQVGTIKEVEALSSQDAYSEGYSNGFDNGFKQGYTEGHKEGLKEGLKSD